MRPLSPTSFTNRPVSVSVGSFATQIEQNDIPVVVDFGAPMAPIHDRMAGESGPEVSF
jgi:hypothetical protein